MAKQEIKKAIKQADKWARDEIIKYGVPIWAYETANKAGQNLAKHFKVDQDLILLGTILMDISLGKAHSQNKINEHVDMCYQDAKEFLRKFDIKEEDKAKILDRVKFHHGTDKFPSTESEIIMNSDCYKFLILENVKKYFKILLEERGMSKEEAEDGAMAKFEEKKNNLTLDYCKKQLEPNYESIEKFLEQQK